MTTFGTLLKYLRRRARLTQRELGIAVGYSEAQIARLEGGRRTPDVATVRSHVVAALHLKDEPELAARLIELAEKAHNKGDPGAGPGPGATVSAAVRQTNLPAQLTRFIGREHDIAEVRRLIAASRLVTLTGPGGMGKTRLAIAVGSTFAAPIPPDTTSVGMQTFPDGVWLVELAPLADPALVARTVANVFGLPRELGAEPVEALVAHIESRQLLLILDNCEHLITACADLAERLLIACPHLRIIATSREGLRIPGEVNWRVPSLSAPDSALLAAQDHFLDYEAVQLFIEHALAARPDFILTPQDITTIAQICARLDGIPLAIEMAAAQLAAMSLQEIAARLDDRFALLTSGRRTALPRQRTLRATLEWSYNLLSSFESALLGRLSIFADGCTLDAAQAVCADALEASGERVENAVQLASGISLVESDVLPLLLQLIQKSLVTADTRDGHTRYRILETIRQFAVEKLAVSGETDAMCRRLADYLTSLALVRANGGNGPPATAWLSRLEAELGNVRALMAWARLRHDDGEMSLRLATALSALWVSRGYLAEATSWLEEALARGLAAPVPLRVEALNGLLRLLYFRGYNLSRWSESAAETNVLSQQIDNPIERFESLYWAGCTAAYRLDQAAARELFQQGIDLARRLSFSHGLAVALSGLGWVSYQEGDFGGANLQFRQSVEVALEGAMRREARRGDASQADVGSVLLCLGVTDVHAAIATSESELFRQRSISNPEDLAIMMQVLGELLLIAGDLERAQAILDECLALWRNTGVQWNLGNGIGRTLLDLGQIAWLRGDSASARSHYEQSLVLCRHAGDTERSARLRILISHTLTAGGDFQRAKALIRRGLNTYREIDQPAGISLALAASAALAEAQGQGERAARLYGAAAAPRHLLLLWIAHPTNRVIRDREIALAKERFSAPQLAVAWADGEGLTQDQAIECAREDDWG